MTTDIIGVDEENEKRRKEFKQIQKQIISHNSEKFSDGYHTFEELYEFRKLYNAGMFNELSKNRNFNVHKSRKHSDGEDCFGGNWFIVIATLPTGQISNHYEMKDWGLFNVPEKERGEKWDGHTSEDVIERLKNFLSINK